MEKESIEQLCGIIDGLRKYEFGKRTSISLIPTENILSPLARELVSSSLVSRYHLVDKSVWEYPDNQYFMEIENLGAKALCGLFDSKYVNLRPISGLNAMTMVIAAFSRVGDCVMTLAPNDGGHGATRNVAEAIGRRCVYIPLDPDSGHIDRIKTERMVDREHIKFVYVDLSNLLFPFDIRGLEWLESIGVEYYFDVSQVLGLLVDPAYREMMLGRTMLFGGSTHKTFPGPQKAIVFSGQIDRERIGKIEETSNNLISSHHINSVGALIVTAMEMKIFGQAYSIQLRRNAKALAQYLSEWDIDVIGANRGFTETHQVWLSVCSGGESAENVVEKLRRCGIYCNRARVPGGNGKVGLRLGSTEVTRLGMAESEMKAIAELVSLALFSIQPEEEVRRRIFELATAFPLPTYCFRSESDLRNSLASLVA